MIFLAAFLVELLVLFLLARALTMHLSTRFYQWGMGEKTVMHLLAIIFLPGTFLHEISHYLMCVILRIKVFGMSLLPKQMESGVIKMGTLEHAKTDLFRDLLIGAAPFIFGNVILFLLLSYSTSHNPFGLNWTTFLIGLAIFEIGNSMFSSKKDMEGSFKFLLILGFIFGTAYLLGWRVSVEQLDQSIPTSYINLIKQGDLFLLVPVILDLIIVGVLFPLNRTRS